MRIFRIEQLKSPLCLQDLPVEGSESEFEAEDDNSRDLEGHIDHTDGNEMSMGVECNNAETGDVVDEPQDSDGSDVQGPEVPNEGPEVPNEGPEVPNQTTESPPESKATGGKDVKEPEQSDAKSAEPLTSAHDYAEMYQPSLVGVSVLLIFTGLALFVLGAMYHYMLAGLRHL